MNLSGAAQMASYTDAQVNRLNAASDAISHR